MDDFLQAQNFKFIRFTQTIYTIGKALQKLFWPAVVLRRNEIMKELVWPMFHFLYVTWSGSSYFARTLYQIKHFFASFMKLIWVVAITSCAKTVQTPTRKTLCIFSSFWSIFEAAMHSARLSDSRNKFYWKNKTIKLVLAFPFFGLSDC